MKYLLDTHAWVWWHMHPQNLSHKVKILIGNTSRYDELLLSAISPWEFSKLLEKGRMSISCDPEDLDKRSSRFAQTQVSSCLSDFGLPFDHFTTAFPR